MYKVVIVYLLIINLIGFVIFYVDKRKAIKHKRRVRERTLFIIAIIGGSLGTYFGMYNFRHKTKKLKFVVGIPLIIGIQILLFIVSNKLSIL